MKTTKWMPATAMTAVILLGASACSTDWGKMDPPAGVAIAPKLENVATYEFEDEKLDPMIFKTHGVTDDAVPSLAQDERKGNVLSLPAGGWVLLHNPLNQVTCQEAASLTFWMKQIPTVDVADDGTETVSPQDLASPLFAFTNESENAHLYFSANGWLDYSAPDGEWSENNPADFATGYMPQGEWNYVALSVRNDGYDLYVNGEKKVAKNVTDFDCSKLVAFMNSVPNLTIGSPDASEAWMIDDLKVYRNALTAKEITRPRLPGEGNVGGGFDFATFEYRVGDPIYNIGASDCSSGWWQEFSNYFRIPAETSLRLTFTNHTAGDGNWQNWNLCLATDAERGEAGYNEYFVIRSDLYGWGGAYDGANFTNTGYPTNDDEWGIFRQDMNGANVVIDIKRVGPEINVKATATCLNGKVYVENFHATCDEGDQIVRAFLIVDGSYLELDNENCYAFWNVPLEKQIVGAIDNSTGWWLEFSDYFAIPSNLSLHLGFQNFSAGTGNWQNWNLCVSTEAERGGDGYEEYFVIRSDLYGWGSAYDGANFTNTGYPTNDDEWGIFRQEMNGAYVDLKVMRDNERVTVDALESCPSGKIYRECFWANCGSGDQTVNAFIICDGSHFEFDTEDCYLFKSVF